MVAENEHIYVPSWYFEYRSNTVIFINSFVSCAVPGKQISFLLFVSRFSGYHVIQASMMSYSCQIEHARQYVVHFRGWDTVQLYAYQLQLRIWRRVWPAGSST